MKKIYGFILLLVITYSCSRENIQNKKNCEDLISQGIIDSFSYPVRPGSPEWATLTKGGKTWEAVNIPNDVLENMCTRGLVYTCVYCPLFDNLVVYNNIHTGFISLRDNINSFKELGKRADSGKELIIYYKTLKPENLDATWSTSRKVEFQVQFYLFEIFFAQQENLSMLNDNELEDLLIEAYSKLMAKEEHKFDMESINSSYYLISNILYHNLNYIPLIDYINRNSLGSFLDDLRPISKESTDSLEYFIHTYVSEI